MVASMNSNTAFLNEHEQIILSRLNERPDSSYTARLAASGDRRVAQKVGEEGIELALAAVGGDRDEVIDEAADLVYHMIVLLCNERLTLADVATRLELRHNDRVDRQG